MGGMRGRRFSSVAELPKPKPQEEHVLDFQRCARLASPAAAPPAAQGLLPWSRKNLKAVARESACFWLNHERNES